MTSFITIDGNRIAYTEAGSPSNPPVLLLHGLMSHRGVWSRTIETLQQDFHCIAIDHLGFGESDKPKDGDYTITKQAERALKVADHFGFEKFILVGHSMGGQIATYLASKLAPERAEKLVSVDGVVTGELSHRTQTLNRSLVVVGEKIPAVYTLFIKLFNSSKSFSCWSFKVWFHKAEELPFDSWKLDRDKAIDPANAYSTAKAWRSVNATDVTPLLKNIMAHTMILYGNQDGTVPVEQAHIFKEQLPAAQLVLIDQCGHFPMYEKFDEYIAPLEIFLREE
jgi:pimeloyl-ACP methyl ester carboxylesterase